MMHATNTQNMNCNFPISPPHKMRHLWLQHGFLFGSGATLNLSSSLAAEGGTSTSRAAESPSAASASASHLRRLFSCFLGTALHAFAMPPPCR